MRQGQQQKNCQYPEKRTNAKQSYGTEFMDLIK